MKIILASASPRRKELLKKIVSDFEIIPSTIEEKVSKFTLKTNVSKKLALLKANDVYKTNSNNLVIGSDTIVYVKHTILGKPKDYEDAKRMIKLLSGKTHKVITGVAIIYKGKIINFKDVTYVTFRKIDENEIDTYCKDDSIYDKAGAYAIQESASRFIVSIKGDYDNVVGLPTIKLSKIMKKEHLI